MGVVLLLFWLGSAIVYCHDGSAIWEGKVAGNWNLVVDDRIVAGAMFDSSEHLVVTVVPDGARLEFRDYEYDLGPHVVEEVVAWAGVAPECHESEGDGTLRVPTSGGDTLPASWPRTAFGWRPM